MWRRNSLRVRNDSDQSISEEEEGLEDEWTGDAISLGGAADKKGGMKLLSQLEMLRDSCELHSTEKESILCQERKGGCYIDDEVEIPVFNDEDGSSHYLRNASSTNTHHNKGMICLPATASVLHSDEEIISDDEKINCPILGSARDNAGGTWSEASREVEALVCLNGNSSCSSSHGVFVKEKKSSRGGGGRNNAKPKFLFTFQSYKKDLSVVVSDRNGSTSNDIQLPDKIGAAADEFKDRFMTESRLSFHDKESEQPENNIELASKHDFKEHSIAEFLYRFEERNNPLQGSSEVFKKRGRRVRMVSKRNTYPLGDRNLDDDELPEALDSESSSDDEENPHGRKPNSPKRTMADQFQDAFGMDSVIDERSYVTPGKMCGLYGKLQQVLQSEKERDTGYLKSISSETVERKCISVRILSKSLEAKLVVCSCAPIEDEKNSYWENKSQMRINGAARTLTIIFNTRICTDVELEVGNLIRVHPPWKEIQVKGNNEAVYLCSYFAQVQP